MGGALTDKITVLRHPTNVLAKTWQADGTIKAYDRAKNFVASVEKVAGVKELSTLLRRLEKDAKACVVRGRLKEGGGRNTRRLLELFDDAPLHAVLIEIDSFEPLASNPVLEPEAAAEEFVLSSLPSCFAGAAFHWQLSNSAGATGKTHLFKAHLWFWLATPYSSAELKAWASALALPVDVSVFNPVQVHYTAAPVFEEGVEDPVPRRSGFVDGVLAVPLVIDAEALAQAESLLPRRRGETVETDDDVVAFVEEQWETFGYTHEGAVVLRCPFEEGHSSGEAGDTSTVYFPAGSGGYAQGHWSCRHTSCTGRKDEDFLDAVGYRAAQFECLPALVEDEGDAPWDGESPRLPLPGFKRDKSGAIEATIDNVRAAIDRIDVCGMDVRHDQFKGEIVWCIPGSGEWQTFYDQHYTELRIRLERLGFKPVGRELIRDVVHYRANQRAIDTAMVWLDGLAWDGKPRVEKFWSTYFGTEDTPYTRACGLYIWSAMAGRVLEPGVQADMVPILTGAQGVGKSRGVAALSPSPAYATVMSFHENETERARKMRGRLVAELAELQGLRSRDLEEIKAWISKSEENWTPKYMEMATVYRRRLILFGTTNDDEFLADPSGERRWLPMAIHAVNVEAIRNDCLQLWAEGRERFAKEGVIWRPAQTLAAAEHGAYRLVDSWEEAVERWLNETDIAGDTHLASEFLTTTSVLLGALGFDARNIKKADEMRMGRILHVQGFTRVSKWVEGRTRRIWQPPLTTSR